MFQLPCSAAGLVASRAVAAAGCPCKDIVLWALMLVCDITVNIYCDIIRTHREERYVRMLSMWSDVEETIEKPPERLPP